MTERPIKFWKATLIFIMIMAGLALSKLSFAAEAICFVNNLEHMEVIARAEIVRDRAEIVRGDIIKKRYIAPGEEICYVADSGTRYIVELEASDFYAGKRADKQWSLTASYGIGVYDISIENNFLRAVVRPQD